MPNIFVPLYLSFKVAFYATLINLFIGVGLAFILSKKNNLLSYLIENIILLPILLPPTVLGYYILVALGSNTVVGQWLTNSFGISFIFNLKGAIIAAIIITLPLVYKPAKVAFEYIDKELIQAGKSLGASNLKVFFRITLPLAFKGIAVGLLLGFIRALGEFGATLMVAGNIEGKTQTLSLAIYEAVQAGQDHLANYLVLIIVIICVVSLIIINFILKQKI